ncbi:MAG: adenylosuccinate lyase [Candidatus Micrarchaeia archaeon]|jgi:adenylosuccinate lyase
MDLDDKQPDLTTSFVSVFSSRYGSQQMRETFSDCQARLSMRKVWCALATAQSKAGLFSKDELADVLAHCEKIDVSRSLEIEKETGHDVVAEIRCFSEQCRKGGKKIHLGATSEDILGNAQILQQKQALAVIKFRIIEVLGILGKIIEENAGKPCMAYTHIQPAEPTTIGYRFSAYAQDLLADLETIESLEKNLKGKGFKGAVGTSASYSEVLKGTKLNPSQMEELAMKQLGLNAFEVSTQTYPRKQDYTLLCALSQTSQSLAKMALDFRILQSPMFGELSEPFGKKQVGSSAMPFKRNPIASEKICSLSRFVQAMPQTAIENASNAILERTLDDSANRRIAIPEAFLALDEMLLTANKILSGIVINYDKIGKNFSDYSQFSGTEILLAELARKGADRQVMHEVIREACMKAWDAVKQGKPNPLADILHYDIRITKYIKPADIPTLLDASAHTGLAKEKAVAMARKINSIVAAQAKAVSAKSTAKK